MARMRPSGSVTTKRAGVRRLRVVGFALMALGVFPVAGTYGATSDAAGWWSRTSSPAPLDPTAAKLEEGQLLVEGGPGGATAITALRWTLDEGETAPTLTITPADGSATPPNLVLQACAATSPWEESAGGPFDEAPTYDCASAVEGTVAEDGSSIELALAPLLQGTTLDVVLVPGEATAPFSLKIDRAAATTLTTTSSSSGFDSGSSSGSFDSGSTSGSFDSGTSSSPASSGSSFAAPSGGTATFDSPATPPPGPPPGPPAETAAGGDTGAVATAAQPLAAFGGGDSDRARNLGIAVLLAGLAVCAWAWVATSSAMAPEAAPATEPAEGGRRFGRFARPVTE